MNDGKLMTCLVFVLFVTFSIAIAFACGTAVAIEKMQKLTVAVEVFSGRPNPSFDITDPGDIARLRESLKGLPVLAMTEEEGFEFSRLGYRGIVITNSSGIEGIPMYVQFLNGKVKVLGAEGGGANFFKDTGGLEKYYLGLAKMKGMITDLLDGKIVPDPDSMPIQ